MTDKNSVDTQFWFMPKANMLLIALMGVLIGFAYLDTIQDMMMKWDTKEEYGYGYIIPFITIFLIWQRKDLLAATEYKPTLWSIPILLFAGFIFFVGAVATTHTLSQYALIITLLAVVYGLLGWNSFKIVAIPIALLFFMVPLPPFIYNNLSGKLQLISSEIGVAVIRWFGISVYLEGNVIDLGSYKLQVVEACSGLRYLFPLMSLSFVAAYLYNVETWKRVVVFLSSIPITVLMNSFRIGVIGVLVEYYGIEQAEGFLHDFEGWVIFMACMGILFIIMAILARVGKNKRKLVDVFTIDLPAPRNKEADGQPRKVTHHYYAILSVLFIVAISSFYAQSREETPQARRDFVLFPMQLGGWDGRKETLETNILGGLKLDDYILSNYKNNSGDNINFYVAYYESQQAGSAAHSPRACIPGGGWKIADLRSVDIPELTFAGKPLSTNRLLIKKGDYGSLVYYWFQQRDRIITNEYLVKWYLFWDALTKNRTDGALVRLTTPVSAAEDIDQADKRLVEFAKQVQPLLDEYIPR